MLLDLSNVSESGLPPAGEYLLSIQEAVVKDSKSGGQYINAKWKFMDGPSQGVTFYTMFTLKNENKTAERIGHSDIKRLLAAAGRDPSRLGTASDLEGIVVRANIAIVEDDYGEKVRIKKYVKEKAASPAF